MRVKFCSVNLWYLHTRQKRRTDRNRVTLPHTHTQRRTDRNRVTLPHTHTPRRTDRNRVTLPHTHTPRRTDGNRVLRLFTQQNLTRISRVNFENFEISKLHLFSVSRCIANYHPLTHTPSHTHTHTHTHTRHLPFSAFLVDLVAIAICVINMQRCSWQKM